MEINLIEDGLVGPFDFTTINKQTHYVGKAQWKQLELATMKHLIDVSDINMIIPLTSL
jgi:hypothetical protein